MNLSYYLLLAIATVESNNDPTAINYREQAYGVFQVRQPVLNDINVHHKLRSLGFTLQDCLDPRIANIVIKLYLDLWATPERLGRYPTDEDLARIWNGGPNGWDRVTTLPYWFKVRAVLEQYKHYYDYTEN